MLAIIIWIACAVWCYALAKKYNRNEVVASILGLLFGVFSVIGYYIAGQKQS